MAAFPGAPAGTGQRRSVRGPRGPERGGRAGPEAPGSWVQDGAGTGRRGSQPAGTLSFHQQVSLGWAGRDSDGGRPNRAWEPEGRDSPGHPRPAIAAAWKSAPQPHPELLRMGVPFFLTLQGLSYFWGLVRDLRRELYDCLPSL